MTVLQACSGCAHHNSASRRGMENLIAASVAASHCRLSSLYWNICARLQALLTPL